MIAFRPPYDLLIAVVGGLAAIAGWMWVLRRGRDGTRHIEAPILGVLNLLGPAGRAWAADDAAALGHLFAEVRESRAEAPRCDVLFLYCDVGPEGTIVHSHRTLREIVRSAKAQIAVVASPNAAADYLEAARETGIDAANLVLTLDRKGPAFARFFGQLFAKMHASIAMPDAWAELQPQTPGVVRPEHPDLVCLMERGPLAFLRGDGAPAEGQQRAA